MASNQVELNVNVLSTAQSSRSRKQKSRGTARPKTSSQAFRGSGKGSPQRRSPKKIDRVTVAECQAKLAKVCGAGGDIEAVRAAFTKFLRFGRSKTGDSLTFEEFIVAAKHCGIMEVEQDYAMFQLMDVNGDGIISFKEFAKILYGHDAEVLNWTYHKANQRLAKTRVEQQQSRIIKTGVRLRQRLQERAAHVNRGEDGPLRGIEVGARVDISSAKNIMRRYGIQHTEVALAELLEFMNPEKSDTILYEDFVTRIFTEPKVRPGVSPPKPDRVLKLPSPQRSLATSESRGQTLNVPVAHDEHGSTRAGPSQDATPALKMLRDSLTAQVGRGSGVGKLLKTFTKFRQNAGAKGKFITFDDFKVALWRSGIRLPADKARDVFYLVDTDQSGTIEYEEFISALFGKEASKGLGITPTIGDGYARQQQHIRNTLANKQSTQFKDADEVLSVMIEKAREDGGANAAYIHFKHASQAHNGLLDLETFCHALRATGINAAPAAAASLFRRLDTSGDGAISYQEFVAGVVGDDTKLSGQHMANIRADWKQRRLQREAQLRQRSSEVVARRFSSEEDPIDVLRDYLDRKLNKHNVLISFKRFRRDSGASGNAITRPEFAKLLRICGLEDLSEEAIAEQFARIDMNGDGFISYNEFCARLFDPEHEIPRKSGRRHSRRDKIQQQLPTLSPNARRDGDATKSIESHDPMSLGELAHVVRGHLLDHPKRLELLLASASASGLRRRGFLAVNASDLLSALQTVREVRMHYGPVTPEALNELEFAVAQHSVSGRSAAGTGIVDFRDLVHYLYRVSAVQDRSSGREPDRVARFDLQQKAKRLEKKIALVDGRGHEDTPAKMQQERAQQQPTDIGRLLEEFRTQFRDTQRSAKAPELRKRAFEDAFRRFRAAGSRSGSTVSPPNASNGSGRVDLMQFRTAIFRSGLYLSRQACQELFHHFDRNGDGFVDSAEFIQAVFPDDSRCVHEGTEPSQHAEVYDRNLSSNSAASSAMSSQTAAKRSADAVLARRSRTSGSSSRNASSDPAEISKQLDLVRQAAQARFMRANNDAVKGAAAATSFKSFLVFVGSASAAEGAATGRDDTGAQVLFVEIPFSAEKARQMVTRLKPRGLVRTQRSEVVAQLLQTLAPNGYVSQSTFVSFLLGSGERRSGLSEGRRRSTERRSTNGAKPAKTRRPPTTAEELFLKLRTHILRQGSSLRFFSSFKTYGAGDGANIDLASFRDGLQLKPDLRGASPAIVQELFDIFDLNGNGNIELDEFVKCMVADAAFENLRSRHLKKGRSVDSGGSSPATGGRSSVPGLDLVDRRKENLQRPRKSGYQRRDVGIALRHAHARSSSQRR